jgi:general secretion pathway protein D
MKLKIRLLAIGIVALLPLASFAQFDFGGGDAGIPPWEEFRLPNTTMRLDFRNSNVDMVLSLFERTAGITIIKDPALTGTINLTSARPVPLREAFQILNTTLSLRGFDMRKEGNFLVIRQRGQRGAGDMNRGQTPPIDMSALGTLFGGANTQLRVFPIEHANASAVARVINDVFAGSQNPVEQAIQMFMQQQQMQQQQQGQQRGRGGFNPAMMRGGMGGRPQSAVRASSDDFSNSVIVNAPDREMRQVEQIIRQIDRQTEQPQQSRVFRLEFASSDELAPVIQNVLVANAPRGRGGMGTQNVPIDQRFQAAARFGGMQAAFGTVVSDPRTNSLVVTGTDDNLELVAQVIKELDTEVQYEASTFVFPLANARADQMAQLMQQAFGTRAGFTGAPRMGQQQFGTRQQQQQQQQRPGQQRPGQQRPGGGLGGGRGIDDDVDALMLQLSDPDADAGELATEVSVVQGGQFQRMMGAQQPTRGATAGQARDAQGRLVNVRDLTGQVTAIPDPNTNSIIVVTSPENAELIRQILEQLDRIPEQVMIETLVVEATLDAASKFGVEWQFSQQNAFGNQGTTGVGQSNFGLQTASPPLQGLRYTLTGGNLNLFLNAIQTDNRFQVLSTPRIFTSNNVQAQINISQSVPYVTSSREDIAGNLVFTYAFLDVGIVLTVTPRITAQGYVTMDVSQTANDLQGFTAFNAPIVNQRQANTTVSVRDGETIILGGIMRNTVTSSVRKVPLLGDIPVLGNLFRSTDRSNVKTELLVFLTPRIVRDADEARRLREETTGQLTPSTQRTIDRTMPPPLAPPVQLPPPGQVPPPDRQNNGGNL